MEINIIDAELFSAFCASDKNVDMVTRYINRNRGNSELYEENGGIPFVSYENNGKHAEINIMIIDAVSAAYAFEVVIDNGRFVKKVFGYKEGMEVIKKYA